MFIHSRESGSLSLDSENAQQENLPKWWITELSQKSNDVAELHLDI